MRKNKKKENIDIFELPKIPELPKEETDTFYKYLDKSSIYFEFGAGGSTYQACIRNNIKKVYSVESDKTWVSYLLNNEQIKNSEKLEIIYVDVKSKPRTRGYPGKSSNYEDWIKYCRAFNKLDQKIRNEIDLIFIDGRFRVACALNIFEVINQDTIVMFDDFLNRKYYHVILKYYDIIESVGRMVVLKKKNVPTPNQELIVQYEKDPR